MDRVSKLFWAVFESYHTCFPLPSTRLLPPGAMLPRKGNPSAESNPKQDPENGMQSTRATFIVN